MSVIGHNRGPSLTGGTGWHRRFWRVARAALLPTLPVEVVRLRVRRAAEIGRDYKTYAGVRATTGHDPVAFLFSNNALRLLREGQRLDGARARKLAATLALDRLLALHPPLDPARMIAVLLGDRIAFADAARVPGLAYTWPMLRDHLHRFLARTKVPADRVLVIGETALERDWAVAGRMAGFLHADRYLPPAGA